MHQTNTPARWRPAGAVAALATLVAASAAAGQPTGLFIDAGTGAPEARAFAAPAGPGSGQPRDSFTLRQRLVEINFPVLPGDEDAARFAAAGSAGSAAAIRLNLFEDVAVTATFEHVEPTFSGGYSLSGPLASGGSMTLVVNGEHVAGTVRTPQGRYRIRPGPDGLHIVSQIDPSRLPPPGEPLQPPDDHGQATPEQAPARP